MKEHIDDFKKHRVQLQEILSLYTTLDVKVLIMNIWEMTDLISRVFEPKPKWEKTMATKAQNLGLGERSKWTESDASLQTCMEAEDWEDGPLLTEIVTKKVELRSKETQSKKLSELRDERYHRCQQNCVERMRSCSS